MIVFLLICTYIVIAIISTHFFCKIIYWLILRDTWDDRLPDDPYRFKKSDFAQAVFGGLIWPTAWALVLLFVIVWMIVAWVRFVFNRLVLLHRIEKYIDNNYPPVEPSS